MVTLIKKKKSDMGETESLAVLQKAEPIPKQTKKRRKWTERDRNGQKQTSTTWATLSSLFYHNNIRIIVYCFVDFFRFTYRNRTGKGQLKGWTVDVSSP